MMNNSIQTKENLIQEIIKNQIDNLLEDIKLSLEQIYWTGYGEGSKDTKENLKKEDNKK